MQAGLPMYTWGRTFNSIPPPGAHFNAGLTRRKHLELPVKLNRNNNLQMQPDVKETSK